VPNLPVSPSIDYASPSGTPSPLATSPLSQSPVLAAVSAATGVQDSAILDLVIREEQLPSDLEGCEYGDKIFLCGRWRRFDQNQCECNNFAWYLRDATIPQWGVSGRSAVVPNNANQIFEMRYHATVYYYRQFLFPRGIN
jgi:hypothetical protein